MSVDRMYKRRGVNGTHKHSLHTARDAGLGHTYNLKYSFIREHRVLSSSDTENNDYNYYI